MVKTHRMFNTDFPNNVEVILLPDYQKLEQENEKLTNAIYEALTQLQLDNRARGVSLIKEVVDYLYNALKEINEMFENNGKEKKE